MKETVDFSIEIPIEDIKEGRAGNINSISWSGTYGGTSNANYRMKLGISWSSVKHATLPFSDVTAKLWLHSAAIRTNGVAKTCTLNINGNSKSHSQTYNQGDWTSTFQIVLLEHSARIEYSGSKTITISGSFDINITYSGVYVGTMSHSVSATLDTILSPPGAPSWCTHTGNFDNGYKTYVNWGASSGTVDRYIVQIRFWDKDTGFGDGSWGNLGQTNSSTTTFEIGHGGVAHDGLQVRVLAQNSAGDSPATEGQLIYHEGIKYYNNGWNMGKTKVWNGSSWTKGYVKVWNGSSWVRP